MAVVIKGESDLGREAVYFTLNECNEALLSRRTKNRLHDQIKETTSDADIVRRRWLFIDFDPRRPKGVCPSTKEEKAAGLSSSCKPWQRHWARKGGLRR